MAAERLRGVQERLAELLSCRDACIAFAAGSVLGSASAALAALYLQRRAHAKRQVASASVAPCKASGLACAVLDFSQVWHDEHLAVGLPARAEQMINKYAHQAPRD